MRRYGGPVLALVLVAFSLGLSNFAAAIGIGVAGVDARTRVRVGLVFGIFEAGMPILGLALGHSLASALGHAAHWGGRWPADRHRRVRAHPGIAGRRRSTRLG
jgi:putative Mn2+ efflux pump MntP